MNDPLFAVAGACGGKKDCYTTLETDCPGPKCAQNVATRDPDPLCLGQLGEALAVGYDWLYDAMSQDERLAVVHAITTQVTVDVCERGGGGSVSVSMGVTYALLE